MEPASNNNPGPPDVLSSNAIVIDPTTSKFALDKNSLLKTSNQNVIPVQQKPPREKVHIQDVKTFRIDSNLLPKKQTAQSSGHSAFEKIAQAINQMPVPACNGEEKLIEQRNLATNTSILVKSTQPSLFSKQLQKPFMNSQKPFPAQLPKFLKLPMQISCGQPVNKAKAIQKPFAHSNPHAQPPSSYQSKTSLSPFKCLKTRKNMESEIYAEEQFVEFINEALYDNEELAQKQVVTVDNSDEEGPAFEENPIEYLLEIRKNHTIAIQTEEVAEDRINCGFINVSKSGPIKIFNLRCFYCDAEYPITFWSEFSDHVLYNHFDLEQAYAKEHETKHSEMDDTKSIATEMDVFHDLETASFLSDDTIHEKFKVNKVESLTNGSQCEVKEKEILPQDFVNNIEDDDWESESDAEQKYMRVECYEPLEDHSYGLDRLYNLNKKHIEPIAEINFASSSRKIVLDFLDHLKGLPSLWHDRKRYPDSYDNELKVLFDVMKEKWQLNFTKTNLRKNLECIKSWYASMTRLKDEKGEQFHHHTYIEYYNKCAEYLAQANTNKQPTVNCDICNQVCSNRIVLQVHKYRRHNVGQLPYSCNSCDKRFDYIYKLISHVKTHIKKTKNKKTEEYKVVNVPLIPAASLPPPPPPQLNFECYECNQNFTCEHEYKRHLDIHPKGHCRYVCEECGRRFRSTGQLTVHKKRHQPPQFQCQLCPKKFYTIFKFRMHTDGHKGLKNYVCEFCGRQFLLQKDYKAHRHFAHMGYGYCKICDREYKNSFIFYRHLKTQHRPIFGTNEELSRRRRRKAKGIPNLKCRKYERVIDPVTQKQRLKCPICDDSFMRYETVYKHAKQVHNYDVPRLPRRQPERRKLTKPLKKRVRGKKAKNVSIDMTAEEAAAAVDAIQELANIKVENYDSTSNEPDPSVGISGIGINVITDAKNSKGIPFEKFINDIATKNNYPFPSSSNMLGMYDQPTMEKVEAPLVAKIEDFEGSAFEFMLNANSPVVKFSYNYMVGSLPATSNLQTTNTSRPIYVTTTLPEEDTKKDELINEALFDNEESAKQHYISVDDAGNTTNQLSTEIKIEDNKPEYDTRKSLLEASTTFTTTTGSQTDEASEDRINCGFVNVSKSGPDKYFNLRCFYCDAEYPITFWSEFSEHILYNHNHLEKKYNKSEEFIFTTSDDNKTNDIDEMNAASDSATEEDLPPIDFISLVNNKINETNRIHLTGEINDSSLKDNLPSYSNVSTEPLEPQQKQQYVCQKKYELYIEHNYSQTISNKSSKDVINNTDELIDEITFENSPFDMIIDFFNNIKGLPSLWLDRKLHPANYDRELLDLMDLMKIRWNLNLRIDNLRKNLEDIKDWFNTMRAAREMSGDSNIKHTFSEYYAICEEFLNKQNNYCDRCKHIAINASRLQVHKYSKHKIGLPPYKCHKCNKLFIYIDNMLKHIRKHEEKKENAPTETNFKCFECDKNFACAKEYKLHLDIHPKGDRPYGCEECGNRFRDMSKLNVHQRQHKSAGYQCEFCPVKLSTLRTFRSHMNAHKGIYEYVCEWCGRSFACRNRWQAHVKYEHMGHGLCKICNREYKKSSILYKHLRNLHRPLIGTIEELSSHKRGRRGKQQRAKGKTKRKMDPKYRKYEYIIDPVTQTRRLKCPMCDLSYNRHRNVLLHASKVHNVDLRSMKRPKREKKEKTAKLSNNGNTWNKIELVKDITLTTSVVEDAPAVAAVNVHIDSAGIEFENPNYNFEDEKNATGISFEKLLGYIVPSNSFSLQSPNSMLGIDVRSTENW